MAEPDRGTAAGDPATRLRALFLLKPDVPSEAEVAELRKAVDEAAAQVRGLTSLFLLVGLYIAILAGTTTHRMLLTGAPIQMPILNVGVSITWAYALAPVLYVIMHFWLMLQLLALARRIEAFDAAVERLPEVQRSRQRGLLGVFPFVEWRAGRRHSRTEWWLGGIVNWVIYAGLPVTLLLWVQLRFLPYQHGTITPLHVALVAIDMTMLWAIWPVLNGPSRLPSARIAGGIGTALAFGATLFLWLDQHRDNRWSHLSVSNQILMGQSPAPQIFAQFRSKAELGQEEEAETAAFLDKEMAQPLVLAGRGLREASLRESRLLGANLRGAELGGADLFGVDLQGADLENAILAEVFLREARLGGANLTGANLLGADLSYAELQGASLDGALLTGVNLEGASLQGADLSQARLRGADLRGARLQGADLRHAELEGADLSGAQLRGATLRFAKLWHTDLDGADLSLADLRNIRPYPLSFFDLIEVQQQTGQFDDARRDRVRERLGEARQNPPVEWFIDALSFEHRVDVLASDEPKTRALVGQGIDEEAYWPQLAAFLADLACGNRWVAKRIVRRMGQGSWVEDVAPWRDAVAERLRGPNCAGAQALDAPELAILDRLLASSNPP